jgi:hypothetical protein
MLFLYAHAVDLTLLAAVGTLTTQQSKGIKSTMEALVHLY